MLPLLIIVAILFAVLVFTLLYYNAKIASVRYEQVEKGYLYEDLLELKGKYPENQNVQYCLDNIFKLKKETLQEMIKAVRDEQNRLER